MRQKKKTGNILLVLLLVCFCSMGLSGCGSSKPSLGLALAYNDHDGNLAMVEDALAAGADIDYSSHSPFKEGSNLRYTTMGWGNCQNMTYYLISRGADVNACSTKDGSPLIIVSAYNANYELTSLLIEKGADVNLHGEESESALTYSVSLSERDEHSQLKCYNLLREHGAEFSEETMEEARNNCIDETKMLLLQTVAKTAKEEGFETGLPLLTEHAILGESEKVLEHFSEYETLTEMEREVFIRACASFCNPEVMEKLMEARVEFKEEISVKEGMDEEGFTYPYLYACAYGNMETLKYMYENKLYPEDDFTTYIRLKPEFFHLDTVKYLAERGFEIDIFESLEAFETGNQELLEFYFEEGLVTGDTYLQILWGLSNLCPNMYNDCADDEWMEMVKLVLDHMDPKDINKVRLAPNLEYCKLLVENYGRTPKADANEENYLLDEEVYALCEVYKNAECVEYLLSKGADPNECDIGSPDEPVLSMAAQYGYYDTCKVLLEHGADPNLAYEEYMLPPFNWMISDEAGVGGSDRLFELFMQYDIDLESELYYGLNIFDFMEKYASEREKKRLNDYISSH